MGKNNFSFAISPGAAYDINIIAVWHNKKIDGLGLRFLYKLKISFDRILISPSSFARYKKNSDIRKYAVAGFPYKIYYIFQDNHVEVLAIIHMSRSNRFTRRKLK